MQLVKYIKDLLYRHDLVIIPDFGALVLKQVPSKIDLENNMIMPPGKTLSFNALINENDGLLAHYVASQDKIPYDSAMNFVQFEVDKLKETLQNEDVTWEGIGTFSVKEGKVQFSPDPSANFDKQSFGLSQVAAAELNRDENDEYKVELADILDDILVGSQQEESLVLEDINEDASSGNRAGFLKYAAGFVLLFGLGYLAWYYFPKLKTTGNEKTSIQQAAFDIPGELKTIDVQVNHTPDATVAENDDQTGSAEETPATGDTPENTTSPGTGETGTTQVAETTTTQSASTGDQTSAQPPAGTAVTPTQTSGVTSGTTGTHSGKFHVIAGAFKFPENAEKKVRQLRESGYDAYIVGVNKWNLTQVAYGNYYSREEAQNALREIRQTHNGKDAWILVK